MLGGFCRIASCAKAKFSSHVAGEKVGISSRRERANIPTTDAKQIVRNKRGRTKRSPSGTQPPAAQVRPRNIATRAHGVCVWMRMGAHIQDATRRKRLCARVRARACGLRSTTRDAYQIVASPFNNCRRPPVPPLCSGACKNAICLICGGRARWMKGTWLPEARGSPPRRRQKNTPVEEETIFRLVDGTE